MQYPLTNFGKKEKKEKEKESVKRKIRKWYNNVKKPNKKEVTVTSCLMNRRTSYLILEKFSKFSDAHYY